MRRSARLALALDVPDLAAGCRLLDAVAPHVDVVKVGLELFVAEGPRAVTAVRDRGLEVFLDLKLHDIPETVRRAVAAAARRGASYLTIHASGGPAMLARAAAEAGEMRLLAVTVLTSLDEDALEAIGMREGTRAWTERLARLAFGSGVAGLVCSAREVSDLRSVLGPDAFLVTPGIRPAGVSQGDQKRTATAAEAVRLGADMLVVGRPIRDADDPAAAALRIREEMASA